MKIEKIKIYCIHPGVNNLREMIEFMCIYNEKLIDRMVWDEKSPNYVVVSENIYRLKDQFLKFRKYYNRKDVVFIGWIGECLSADMNLFDYAISYEKEFNFSDRISRIPPVYIFQKFKFKKNNLTVENAKNLLLHKDNFCNFIYSNANAHPMRDKIFFALSHYKKVDSLGAHLNNMHISSTRTEKNWRELSVNLKEKYKFSIAAENAVQHGYNSEKIMTSFIAHTVPIYFGDPSIVEEYNPKAFINANAFESLDDLVREVARIDRNDELWIEMVLQPWQTDEQIKRNQREMEEYQTFIAHIFEQDLMAAKRVIVGSHHNLYLRWFFKRFSCIDNLKYKIKTFTYKKRTKKILNGIENK